MDNCPVCREAIGDRALNHNCDPRAIADHLLWLETLVSSIRPKTSGYGLDHGSIWKRLMYVSMELAEAASLLRKVNGGSDDKG